MRFRDSWKPDARGDKVCVWCGRFASKCVIEDPCDTRKRYEERDLRGVTVVPDPPDFELPWA